MNSAEQVLFVLETVLVLGPLAVYFLTLGLVNSLSRPCLVNARLDFVLLTIAFVPLILAPLVALVQHGHLLLSVIVLAVVGAIFFAMLPQRCSNWVIYNCSLQQCRRLMAKAAQRSGWSLALGDEQARFGPSGLSIQISTLPWLRNVTLRLSGADDRADEAFLAAFRQELAGEAMLPSPTGASLVVIGAALLGVPMWYLLHHIRAIVDVVRQILFA